MTTDLAPPYSVAEDAFRRGDAWTPLRVLESRAQDYLESPFKGPFLEHAGTLRSFLGDYRKALEYFDRREPVLGGRPAADLSGLRAEPVLEALRGIGSTRQAVFINEAHHVPQHRAFTLRALHGLRKLGFGYFAAETLNEWDRSLSQRGYPLLDRSGYYTREPFYGDLVRTALKLGFKVVAYEESGEPAEEKPGEPYYLQNRRERAQAQNLLDRVLKADPHARLVVHAGYGHIDKRGDPEASTEGVLGKGWVPMARYFKALTGIDPFSLDQVQLMEHDDRSRESPEYGAALATFDVESPSLLRGAGNWWVESLCSGCYDAHVIHPRAAYERGRPTWTLLGGQRRLSPVPEALSGAERPLLIQAFHAEEGAGAVPVDQFLAEGPELPALALPDGKFRVRALGPDGRELGSALVIQ